MKLLHKLTRVVLAVCMAAQLLAVPAFAAGDKPVYLALGDDISTRDGLSAQDKSFVELIAAQLPDHTVVNRAEEGNTAADIYQMIAGGDLDEEIANAGVITITWGGNGMMNALYKEVVKLFNEKYGTTYLPEQVPDMMRGTVSISATQKVYLATFARRVVRGDADIEGDGFSSSAAFADALAQFQENAGKALERIRALNPTAYVIVNTQYNPYKAFESETSELYKSMAAEIALCLPELNEAIAARTVEIGYVVSDVCAAFEPYNGSLCNAKANGDSPVLDFHPTAEGHAVIAETVLDTLNELKRNTETPSTIVMEGGKIVISNIKTYSCVLIAYYNDKGKMLDFDVMCYTSGAEDKLVLQPRDVEGATNGKVFFLNRGRAFPHCEQLPF